MPLGRIMTAMVTAMHADESVNYAESARLAQWLIHEGNNGVVVCGTTGEAPTLDRDEKLKLFSTVRDALPAHATVIANTGSNDTRGSVALTREARQCNVDGILAVVPYYNKPTQEGMLRHFGAIAEATDLPVIVYNVPSRTGMNMLPDTMRELARRHGNIAGVKESTGDVQQFSEILRDRAESFSFWVGDDPYFLPSLALGAYGLISVAAHLCGRELAAMLAAFDRGDTATAAAIHLSLTKLFRALFSTSNPIPVKWALARAGFAVGPVRSPLAPLPVNLEASLGEAIAPFLERVQVVPAP